MAGGLNGRQRRLAAVLRPGRQASGQAPAALLPLLPRRDTTEPEGASGWDPQAIIDTVKNAIASGQFKAALASTSGWAPLSGARGGRAVPAACSLWRVRAWTGSNPHPRALAPSPAAAVVAETVNLKFIQWVTLGASPAPDSSPSSGGGGRASPSSAGSPPPSPDSGSSGKRSNPFSNKWVLIATVAGSLAALAVAVGAGGWAGRAAMQLASDSAAPPGLAGPLLRPGAPAAHCTGPTPAASGPVVAAVAACKARRNSWRGAKEKVTEDLEAFRETRGAAGSCCCCCCKIITSAAVALADWPAPARPHRGPQSHVAVS